MVIQVSLQNQIVSKPTHTKSRPHLSDFDHLLESGFLNDLFNLDSLANQGELNFLCATSPKIPRSSRFSRLRSSKKTKREWSPGYPRQGGEGGGVFQSNQKNGAGGSQDRERGCVCGGGYLDLCGSGSQGHSAELAIW